MRLSTEHIFVVGPSLSRLQSSHNAGFVDKFPGRTQDPMTMSGLVAIEEAFQIPELRHEAKNHAPGAAAETLAANLVDITQQRLQKMDAHNIDKMVLSLTSPGPQGRSSATEAAALACKANNYLSSECRKYASRFAGFCALSMHSPDEACTELRRNMKDLGMVGAMINDFQDLPNGQSGYYDGPEWDEFWSEVETLDAIIYFHPRFPHPDVRAQMYGGRPGIVGAAWSFAVGVGTLLLGLCTNGVFDRHPKAKVVVGHMGKSTKFTLPF